MNTKKKNGRHFTGKGVGKKKGTKHFWRGTWGMYRTQVKQGY